MKQILKGMSKEKLLDYIDTYEKKNDEMIKRLKDELKLHRRREKLIIMFLNGEVKPQDIDDEMLEILDELKRYKI